MHNTAKKTPKKSVVIRRHSESARSFAQLSKLDIERTKAQIIKTPLGEVPLGRLMAFTTHLPR